MNVMTIKKSLKKPLCISQIQYMWSSNVGIIKRISIETSHLSGGGTLKNYTSHNDYSAPRLHSIGCARCFTDFFPGIYSNKQQS